MQFAEAEKQYRELEEKLLRGELSEDDFTARVAELRVLDEAGRRWMLSGRTGRWLVHDGKQWVFADPSKVELEPEVEAKVVAPAEAVVEAEEALEVVPAPAAVPAPPRPQPEERQSAVPQLLGLAVALLLVAACLIGGGAAAWVFVLRDVGEPALIPTDSSAVSLVQTYTPRPATPTYTPTDTPTPSRTPTPTNTPIATNTPVPTDTPVATDTSVPTATPTPGPTRTSTAPVPSPESAVASPTTTATAVPTATASAISVVVSAQTYTIKVGDTLYEIATSFGVSTAALAEANNITDPRRLRAGQVLVIPGTGTVVAAAPSPQTYTVQPGDTLNEIASRFGVSATALAEANGITDATLLRSGQVLVIPTAGTVVTGATGTPTAVAVAPSPQTYTVQPGDTLNEIASRFGVSATALAEANDITNAALIRSGQVLVIPVAGIAAVASTAGPTPTWTPIVLQTPTTVAPTSVASARTPSPTPTRSGAAATPQPTATPTAKPAVLLGKLAFTVWNPYTGKYELYVSRVDGSGRNLLGEGFRQPQFRQDGNLLAVNGDGAPDLEHLVTMNPSGGDKQGVSQYSEDSFPTWAPDGAIVAFSSDAWGDGKTRLGIVNDMFGVQQDWIPMGNLQIEGEYPFWMADGRIVYRGCDPVAGGGNCGLYWVGAGGGGYHRVTNHESDTAPAGSGSRVAFMSARDGNWEVYAVDINGGTAQRLTNSPAQDGLPTWSPDGKSIAFVSDRGGNWAIWVMSADGSNQRKLFDLSGGYGGGEYDWKAERISWAP